MSRGRRWEGKGEAEYLTIVITICCVGGGGWWTFVYYHKVLIPRRIVSHYFHHICWVLRYHYRWGSERGWRDCSRQATPKTWGIESNLMRCFYIWWRIWHLRPRKFVSMSITDLSILCDDQVSMTDSQRAPKKIQFVQITTLFAPPSSSADNSVDDSAQTRLTLSCCWPMSN
jgi:hypothetical protein